MLILINVTWSAVAPPYSPRMIDTSNQFSLLLEITVVRDDEQTKVGLAYSERPKNVRNMNMNALMAESYRCIIII